VGDLRLSAASSNVIVLGEFWLANSNAYYEDVVFIEAGDESPQAAVAPDINPAAPNPDLEEALSEALFDDPSLFGRLIAIAALRDISDGTYKHRLSERFGQKEVDKVLQELHGKVFFALLNLSLRQRMADLAVYFNGEPGRDAKLTGLQEFGEQAIPASAKDNERSLFIHELGIAQSLLLYEL
jgi:hypothetical protein